MVKLIFRKDYHLKNEVNKGFFSCGTFECVILGPSIRMIERILLFQDPYFFAQKEDIALVVINFNKSYKK
jgi:hypothetical protein